MLFLLYTSPSPQTPFSPLQPLPTPTTPHFYPSFSFSLNCEPPGTLNAYGNTRSFSENGWGGDGAVAQAKPGYNLGGTLQSASLVRKPLFANVVVDWLHLNP